ncbi:MAG: hypothetical protein OEZ43_20980 [Gammaproteobacteria bacterium]|nr:hypothetical protein [Gammaproteobacteria bacterium]
MLDGKKTHLAVLGGMLFFVSQFLQGDIELGKMVEQIVYLLPFSTIRVGISKSNKKSYLP